MFLLLIKGYKTKRYWLKSSLSPEERANKLGFLFYDNHTVYRPDTNQILIVRNPITILKDKPTLEDFAWEDVGEVDDTDLAVPF